MIRTRTIYPRKGTHVRLRSQARLHPTDSPENEGQAQARPSHRGTPNGWRAYTAREETPSRESQSKQLGGYFFFAFFAVFFAFFAVFFAFLAAMVFFPFSTFADLFCFCFVTCRIAGLAFRTRDFAGAAFAGPP